MVTMKNQSSKEMPPLKLGSSQGTFKMIIMSGSLIILLGMLVYANSLRGQFLYDDEALIERNVFIHDITKIGGLFTGAIGQGSGLAFETFYRPVPMLTHALNYAMGGLNVTGYHVVNLCIHLLVALSIYWMVNLLFKNAVVACLTAIFFVVHPIHTEAVSYISGRADLLAALFFILSMVGYIYQVTGKSSLIRQALVLFSFAAALLSKEYALILPLVLCLYHFSFRIKIKWFELLSLTAVGFLYIVFRLTYLKDMLASSVGFDQMGERVPGVFAALSGYLKLLFIPYPLHMERGLKLFQWSDPSVLAGILLAGTILYFVYKNRTAPLVVFSAGWFLVCLFPLLNLYKINYYMADHFLYLPSIGFFLICSFYLNYLWQQNKLRPVVITFIGIVLIALICLTIRQNDYWKDPKTFYETTLKYAPDAQRMYNNLGKLLQEEGKTKEALLNYSKAIELNSTDYLAYNNRGSLYGAQGRYQEAVDDLTKAIRLKVNYAPAYDNLGHVYDAAGDRAQAIAQYSKSIELNPNYALAYNNRGSVYIDQGRYQEAIADLTKAIRLNPQLASAYSNRGNAFVGAGDYGKAIDDYNAAIRINPNKSSYYRNRDVAYRRQQAQVVPSSF